MPTTHHMHIGCGSQFARDVCLLAGNTPARKATQLGVIHINRPDDVRENRIGQDGSFVIAAISVPTRSSVPCFLSPKSFLGSEIWPWPIVQLGSEKYSDIRLFRLSTAKSIYRCYYAHSSASRV
jgi:hypothetical protein